jgi:putative membrane protein
MKLLTRWLVLTAALFVAAWLIPGIHVEEGGWVAYAVMAAVLGLLNALLLPLLRFLSCGLIVLTLGLFSLVLNAGVFMLASQISQSWFNAGFVVDGFWPALLGSIVVSLINLVFSRESQKDKE